MGRAEVVVGSVFSRNVQHWLAAVSPRSSLACRLISSCSVRSSAGGKLPRGRRGLVGERL
jgi:hypothetical protein